MAGVDVGGGEKRPKNADINMIPFIDLLMVTIAFLLITAVWVTNSRISTNAEVPGQTGCGELCADQQSRVMHVHVQEDGFNLVWKHGKTVLSEVRVPKDAVELGSGGMTALRYGALVDAVKNEWQRSGEHREAVDRRTDQAVLHSDNRTPFRELIAVLDAISATRREMVLADGSRTEVSAFSTTFSAM
jgi:biopolymer transport protein ExbD